MALGYNSAHFGPIKGTEGSRVSILDAAIAISDGPLVSKNFTSQSHGQADGQSGLCSGPSLVEGGVVTTLLPDMESTPKFSSGENRPSSCKSGAGDTKGLLSGAALRAAFSKALLRSSYSAEEKGRVLEMVSAARGDVQVSLMREWLHSLLQNSHQQMS